MARRKRVQPRHQWAVRTTLASSSPPTRQPLCVLQDYPTPCNAPQLGARSLSSTDSTRHTVLMLRLCWQPGISRLLLVKHAADPNKRDEAGCTPLIFAAYAGFAKGVEMLLKKGAECDARDRLGHTALHSVASALDQVKKRWFKPAEDGSSPGYFTMYGHCLSAAITLGHSPFLPLPFFHFFRLGNPGSGTKRHGSGNQQWRRKEPLPPTSALRPSGTSPRKVTARRTSGTRGLRSC